MTDFVNFTFSQIMSEHQLNLRYEECAGLGNDYNDIDFLNRCGHPFIVSNAPESLREQFDTMPADEDNGLAAFVRHSLNL